MTHPRTVQSAPPHDATAVKPSTEHPTPADPTNPLPEEHTLNHLTTQRPTERVSLTLATRNPGKLAELRELLAGLPYVLRPLPEEAEEVEETGATFLENAALKAVAASRDGGLALADDSGLEVDALAGAPGVLSARYAGPGATAEQRNAKLLAALEGVPAELRTARFRCVVAIARGGEVLWTGHGECHGRIAETPRGAGGFGYDPVFLLAPEYARAMAELSPAMKNRVSHRAHAMRAAVAWLAAHSSRK
jgi:XTP/dITP diphosphohydrolase